MLVLPVSLSFDLVWGSHSKPKIVHMSISPFVSHARGTPLELETEWNRANFLSFMTGISSISDQGGVEMRGRWRGWNLWAFLMQLQLFSDTSFYSYNRSFCLILVTLILVLSFYKFFLTPYNSIFMKAFSVLKTIQAGIYKRLYVLKYEKYYWCLKCFLWVVKGLTD